MAQRHVSRSARFWPHNLAALVQGVKDVLLVFSSHCPSRAEIWPFSASTLSWFILLCPFSHRRLSSWTGCIIVVPQFSFSLWPQNELIEYSMSLPMRAQSTRPRNSSSWAVRLSGLGRVQTERRAILFPSRSSSECMS